MEQQHTHCVTCLSQRCMTRLEPGISCELVPCSLACGAIFHACKGPEHRLLCPLERIPCLNGGFGCPVTLVRTQMSEHLEVCPAGVVCCTMGWNRWPISCLDYTSYESLSWGVEETEQLDMALALQDQHTLIESLKVVAMAPTIERQAPVVSLESEKSVAECVAVTSEASFSMKQLPHLTTLGTQLPPLLSTQSPPLLTPEPRVLLALQPLAHLTGQETAHLTGQAPAHLTGQAPAHLTGQAPAQLTVQPAMPLTVQPPVPLTEQPPAPLSPHQSPMSPQSSMLVLTKDKIASGINCLNEKRYSKLYEATVETARSLAAALDVLSNAKSSSNTNTNQCVNLSGGTVLEPQDSGRYHVRFEEPVLQNMLEVKGIKDDSIDVEGCFGQLHQLHQATANLRRSLVTALGDLGNTVKYTDPISGAPSHPQVEPNFRYRQLEVADSRNVEMKTAEAGSSLAELIVFRGMETEAAVEGVSNVNMPLECSGLALKGESVGGQSLCNGFCRKSSHKRPGVFGSDSVDQQQPDISWCSSEAACQVRLFDDLSPSPVLEGPFVIQSLQPQHHPAPPVAPPLCISQGIAHRASHLVLDDKGLERKFQNDQLLRGLGQFALSNRRRVRVRLRPKMEDKAVDTSDLEPEEDPMGLGEIDLINAALLFCLEESRKCRRISDTTYVDGFHVDFGTQTFTFPAAILVTNTRVGDVASAAACDHAPQHSYPSPFRTLRLDLVLEEVPQIQNIPCNRTQQMFSFVCGQLFRRDEYSSHFKNVHEDIHAGLNGWMEHRCPLAYYGCTYSQRRFCPTSQGSKVIHDRNLRSFGVQPCPTAGEPLGQSDQFSGLPFEVLQHVARFLDGFSLCQLSVVSRTMRDVCASLLQSRGIVELRWERRQYPNGTFSWQIKDRVWRFSTAFSFVSEWRFAELSSMSDHLRKCRYNTIERKMEAIPLPSMCTARDRSLLSVLKLQEQHKT